MKKRCFFFLPIYREKLFRDLRIQQNLVLQRCSQSVESDEWLNDGALEFKKHSGLQ